MARRPDLLALAAAVLALAVAALYVFLTLTEGTALSPAPLLVLVGSGLGATYATRLRAPYRRAALVISAVGLLGLGYLAIFTIGLPLLLAGALCAAAALRARPQKDWRDMV